MGFAILWGFFYLTVSIDLAIKAANFQKTGKSFAPACFFGLITMGLYGSEAWLIFKQWQVQMFMQEIDEPDPFGENLPAGNIQDTANYN
jgi:hypothetical protein